MKDEETKICSMFLVNAIHILENMTLIGHDSNARLEKEEMLLDILKEDT